MLKVTSVLRVRFFVSERDRDRDSSEKGRETESKRQKSSRSCCLPFYSAKEYFGERSANISHLSSASKEDALVDRGGLVGGASVLTEDAVGACTWRKVSTNPCEYASCLADAPAQVSTTPGAGDSWTSRSALHPDRYCRAQRSSIGHEAACSCPPTI